MDRVQPHSKDPTTDVTVSRSQIAKRRSRRMFLNASVALSGEDRLKCSFTMPAGDVAPGQQPLLAAGDVPARLQDRRCSGE
jgi:hypothetical protein